MKFHKPLLHHKESTVFETKSGSLFIEEKKAASVAVVVLHEGKITLVKQFRHQMAELTFELPGGGLESNEDAEQGAKRELKEETGIVAEQFTYLGKFHPQPYFINRFSHLYFTDSITSFGNQKLDEDEEIEVVHMPVSIVFKTIREGKISDGELGYALFLCQLNGFLPHK
ncbi:NUDIX hydrolase [Pseudalkalibacillus salsuginis]|uniref:NUDIX hydrolase n=1 Tax=Pseudalkalibacillus salsuginis TaxID=2910972 RepID=UPI001F305F37|nr:NUDIX hydrolase [Pseudalkalibacillus salsuginis]MCF6411021.1 NUDIX hydrolase [Pseudalkalibacillus salsuginis]